MSAESRWSVHHSATEWLHSALLWRGHQVATCRTILGSVTFHLWQWWNMDQWKRCYSMSNVMKVDKMTATFNQSQLICLCYLLFSWSAPWPKQDIFKVNTMHIVISKHLKTCARIWLVDVIDDGQHIGVDLMEISCIDLLYTGRLFLYNSTISQRLVPSDPDSRSIPTWTDP